MNAAVDFNSSEGETYLSDDDLAKRFGVTRPTIWRWVKKESLPAPVKLSGNCTRWITAEVAEWAKSRPRAI